MHYQDKKPAYYGNIRSEMLPFIPEACRCLLDVGCGAGGFGALIKKKIGSEVWGVEPMAEAAEIAQDRLDSVITLPFTADLDLPRGKFDVITFNDSLEHFPHPESPLEFCHDLLAPGGVIVCSVPNVRYIDNMTNLLIGLDWKYEDDGILDSTHLRFFTQKSIVRTFTSLGYRIESVARINPRAWWGWKHKLLERLLGKYIADMRYKQIVVVAKSDKRPDEQGQRRGKPASKPPLQMPSR